MPNHEPPHQSPRGAVLPVLPLVAGLVLVLAFVGGMVGVMAMWNGDHMGMMRRGSAGADQAPVVASERQVTVEMRNFEFFPAKLTVDAGAEVTWLNTDSVPHNAIADDGAFDTGTLNQDDQASVTLDRPGAYPYVCTFHPGMEATITVR